jgi:tRNA pseudouridine38-40 synthase
VQSYKLTVAYDGTNYHGWQWQPNESSVERVLRETFLLVFHQTDLFLVGASRTDAGVHADGQTVRIGTKLAMDPLKMISVWNDALPDDIVIQTIEQVDTAFHPQHGVVAKTYQYRIFTERPTIYIQRFGYYFQHKFDYKKLADCLTIFVGTHDFKAFCKEEDGKDTVRTIQSISIRPCPKMGGFVIEIVGPSFLRYMIRRIVGAALRVASMKQYKKYDLGFALKTGKITKVLPTAPAKGLCLHKIEYQ